VHQNKNTNVENAVLKLFCFFLKLEIRYVELHSQVYNDRTVAIIMAECIAHARNGDISTSALKSDVTIVFLAVIIETAVSDTKTQTPLK